MITGKLVAVTLLCALAGICLSTGCSGVISPAPSSPPSPTLIATASPTLTPTLTVTRLPLPTATMAPTTTSTPAITRTPSPVAEDMSGWTAKQGGPDGARANLTSRVAAPVGLAWEWQEQDNRPVAIAATGDFVFLLTGRGQLCILDAATGAKKTCRTIWPDTKGSTSGQIALNGDTVLVSALELYIKPGDRYGTARTRLSAFSMDGQPRWMSPIVDNQSGEAIVAGEGVVVYVSRTDVDQYWLTALDLTTGLQRWRIPGSFEHAATDGKVLYMAGQSVSALHLSTGARLWEQITGARHVLYSQGRVIAVGDNTIVALDAPTGKVMWKKDFGVFPLTGEEVGIAAAHGRVYVKPAPGQTPQGYRTGVMALDAASGKELWSAGAGPDRWVNQIAATADSLVVTGQEWDGNTFARRLWLLNPANGAELDRSVVSPDPMDEMNGLAVAGDRVYVLGRSLRVFRPTPRK